MAISDPDLRVQLDAPGAWTGGAPPKLPAVHRGEYLRALDDILRNTENFAGWLFRIRPVNRVAQGPRPAAQPAAQ